MIKAININEDYYKLVLVGIFCVIFIGGIIFHKTIAEKIKELISSNSESKLTIVYNQNTADKRKDFIFTPRQMRNVREMTFFEKIGAKMALNFHTKPLRTLICFCLFNMLYMLYFLMKASVWSQEDERELNSYIDN